MAEQFETPPVTPFKYELVEDDTDNLKTVDATPNQAGSWIDPASLNLKHRIGRGPFGDVWLATHHQSANDYDEFHEVAVKMLPPLKDEAVQSILKKFDDLFFKIRALCGVGWLHGVSVLQEKICIVMKFYEKSLSDQMARIKGGKLRVSDILRYGVELARGILELHSIGVLLLNLKPSNFLLDDHDHVFLGDIGIPNLLHEVPLADPDMVLRLGTPNYMAPEQWEPEVRGPMMLETDSWGFGCSIVELLSGTQPWCGMTVAEIYRSVMIRQEQPSIPSGLPHAIEDVIRGCFEYDPRNRPSMKDILRTFDSFKSAVSDDEESVGIESKSSRHRPSSCWYLLKDRIKVGDEVRSRKPLNGSEPWTLDVPEGCVVDLETDGDNESFALVKITRLHNVLRVRVSTLERVTFGFAAGDWVRLKVDHSSLGILHSVHRNGAITVGLVGLSTLWQGRWSEIEKVEGFYVGQFVRVKDHVVGPRFEWPRRRNGTWATGRVSKVLPNGCLVVSFPGRFVFKDNENSFLADPAEVGSVTFGSCDGLVKKYGHVEDFHWSVRPVVVALGVLTAVKIGLSMRRTNKGCKNSVQSSNQSRDSCQGGGGRYIVPWLPPPVASILFGDGESIRV